MSTLSSERKAIPATPAVEIGRRLAAMHWQWRNVIMQRGLARLVLLAVALSAAFCLLDELLNLSFPFRLALALSACALLAAHSWRNWLRYCLRPYSPRAMAWMLESVFPEFHEKLISAVELARQEGRDRGISGALVQETLAEASLDVAALSPQAVFPPNWRAWRLPAAMVGLFLVSLLIPELDMSHRLKRIALPAAADASVGRVRIVLSPGSRIRDEGDTIVFEAVVSGRAEGGAELVVEAPAPQRYVMVPGSVPGTWHFRLRNVEHDLRAWAVIGKSRSETQSVRVRKRPRPVEFAIEYRFPGYAAWALRSEVSPSGDLRALQGSEADLEVRASQELSQCHVSLDGVSHRAALSADRRSARYRLPIGKNGHYQLELVDRSGLRNAGELRYEIKAVPDIPPRVVMVDTPAVISLEIDQAPVIRWQASDDFGIVRQAIRVSDGSGATSDIDVPPARQQAELALDRDRLLPGQRLHVTVLAEDAAGQIAESTPVEVLVGGSPLDQRLKTFRGACRDLGTVLGHLASDLEAARTYMRYLDSFKNIPGSSDPHYQLMLARNVDSIGMALKNIRDLTLHLKTHGTFPGNRQSSELLRLYVEQELLFSAPGLSGPNAFDCLERLRLMTKLCREMCAALDEKAQQHQDVARMEAMLDGIGRMEKFPDGAEDAARVRPFAAVVFGNFPELADGQGGGVPQNFAELGERLSSLMSSRRRQIADAGLLDKLNRAVAEQLRGLEQQLRELAGRLKKGGADRQWQEALSLAVNYAQIAERETSPARRADSRLLASALHKATAERWPAVIEMVAEGIPALDSDQRRMSLARDLLRTRFQAEKLRDRSADGAAVGRQDVDRLVEACGSLLSEFESVQAIERHDRLDSVAARVAETMAVISPDSGTGVPESRLPPDRVVKAVDLLDQAWQNLQEKTRGESLGADVLRIRLAGVVMAKSERLAALAASMSEVAEQLQNEQGTLASITEATLAIDHSLAQLAQELRDVIIRDLGLFRHPAAGLPSAWIIQNMLEEIRRGDLTRMPGLLRAAARQESHRSLSARQAARSEAAGIVAAAAWEVYTLAAVAGDWEKGFSSLHIPVQPAESSSRIQASGERDDLFRKIGAALSQVEALEIADAGLAMIGSPPFEIGSGQSSERAGRIGAELLADLGSLGDEALAASQKQAFDKAVDCIDRIRAKTWAASEATLRDSPETAAADFPEEILGEGKRLADLLSHMDAINRVGGSQQPELSPGYRERILPALDEGLKQSPGDQAFKRYLSAALNGLVALQDEMAGLDGPRPAPGTSPAAEGVLPPRLPAESMAGLEALLKEGERLAAGCRALAASIQQGRDLAVDTMRQLADQAAPGKAGQFLDLADAFAEADLQERLGLLGKAAELAPSDGAARSAVGAAEAELAKEAGRAEPLARMNQELAGVHSAVIEGVEALVGWVSAEASFQAAKQRHVLTKLSTNTRAGNFTAALANLDVLRHVWPVRHSQLWLVPRVLVFRPPPPQRPELLPANWAGLDLNALNGLVIELAKEDATGAFAGSPEAVSAAAVGSYRKAARLSSGKAACEFSKAAARWNTMSQVQSDVYQAVLATEMAAERLQAIVTPPPACSPAVRAIIGLAGEAERAAEQGLIALNTLRAAFPDNSLGEIVLAALRDPDLPPSVSLTLVEAMRELKGGRVVDAVEKLRDTAGHMLHQNDPWAKDLTTECERILEIVELRESAKRLREMRSAFASRLGELSRRLAGRSSIPASEAHALYQTVPASLETANWASVQAACRQASRAVAELIRHQPLNPPLNEPAVDAVAAAQAIGGAQAVRLALSGNYPLAAKQMASLADKLPAGGARTLAIEACRDFRLATAAAKSTLPPQLRQAADALHDMVDSGSSPETFPPALARTMAAVLARDFRRALVELDCAFVDAGTDLPAELADLPGALQRADQEIHDQRRLLPPSLRGMLQKIEPRLAQLDPLPKAYLGWAVLAAERGSAAAAAGHLALARQAPLPRDVAEDVDYSLNLLLETGQVPRKGPRFATAPTVSPAVLNVVAGLTDLKRAETAQSRGDKNEVGRRMSSAADKLKSTHILARVEAIELFGQWPREALPGNGETVAVPEGRQGVDAVQWMREEGVLGESRVRMKTNDYDTYYRQVNKRYLEQIAREGKYWGR